MSPLRFIALLALAAACDEPRRFTSCDAPLGGVYDSAGRHWMILDNRGGRERSLEAYPLFPDAPAVAGLEVTPRVLDLAADGTGNMRRRYLRGAQSCTAKVPARLTRCADDTLELVLADPVPPIQFAPCAFGRPDGSRVERWRLLQ